MLAGPQGARLRLCQAVPPSFLSPSSMVPVSRVLPLLTVCCCGSGVISAGVGGYQPTVPILTVLTCRLDFQSPWRQHAHLTSIVLPRLSPPHIQTRIARLTGEKPLPPEVLEHLVVKTDGGPLFVEELTKMVLEAGFLHAVHDHYELTRALPPMAIPASLHDALMARLDRLATVKGVAQLSAVLGRHFPYALLQAVADLDEITLQRTLEQSLNFSHCVAHKIWRWRGISPLHGRAHRPTRPPRSNGRKMYG